MACLESGPRAARAHSAAMGRLWEAAQGRGCTRRGEVGAVQRPLRAAQVAEGPVGGSPGPGVQPRAGRARRAVSFPPPAPDRSPVPQACFIFMALEPDTRKSPLAHKAGK